MYETGLSLSYSIGVFSIVLISGSILNLYRKHFVFQLTGIAFFFTYAVLKLAFELRTNDSLTIKDLYFFLLPMLSGISACLISMVLGFWIFPPVRKKFKA